MTMTPEQASGFHETFGRLVAGVEQVLLGKTFVVRLGFIALFSESAIFPRIVLFSYKRRGP